MRGIAIIVGLAAALPARAEVPGWRGYEEFAKDLRARAAASEGRGSVSVIGRSHEGRELLCVTVGASPGAEGRPALLIVAGVDADGAGGAEIAARAAALLMEPWDERTRKLLEERTVFVIPRLNPDGLERWMSGGEKPENGTARPWDADRDGEQDEDGADDLDGDGAILQMRVEDPNGDWVADAADAGLMRPPDAAKGERGVWRVLAEGKDDDGDGEINEDGPGGVQLNANFTWEFRMHGRQCGPYPMSEPESRALADFVVARRNIAAALVLTWDDNAIRQVAPANPPDPLPDVGSPPSALDPGDILHFARLAEKYRAALGLERRDPGKLWGGGCWEWLYFDWGMPVVASPGWILPWKAADAKGLPHEERKAREERWMHRWLKANRPGAWVEWHAVEHPDFPGKMVEIGGWKPRGRDFPDPSELPAISAKHADFVRTYLEAFPRVAVEGVTAKKLDEALWEVTATVRNDGDLPTALRHGERTHRARAVRVEIAGATVLGGDRVVMIPSLGRGTVAKEVKWTVNARAGAEIEVFAETDRAGTASWKGALK